MKTLIKKLLPISLFCFCSLQAFAAIKLQNLSKEEIQGVLREFATSFVPTTVTPPSSHGDNFGLEAGIMAGVSESPHIKNLMEEDGETGTENLPHGAGLAVLYLPNGLGFELQLMPVESDGIKYDYKSFGFKWTFTDLYPSFPFDIRFRLNTSSGNITFQQSIGNIPIQVEFENKSATYNLTFGKRFWFIEPYFGVGKTSSSNSLKSTGNVSIFNVNVPIEYRENVDIEDSYTFYGLQFHMWFLKFAFENTSVYDNKKASFKLSFAFGF